MARERTIMEKKSDHDENKKNTNRRGTNNRPDEV